MVILDAEFRTARVFVNGEAVTVRVARGGATEQVIRLRGIGEVRGAIAGMESHGKDDPHQGDILAALRMAKCAMEGDA